MQQIQKIKVRITQEYDHAFNYFQSKSINAILIKNKARIPILFRDLEFMSDEIEYLKRFYMINQSLVRILKLINYYDTNMEPPKPNTMPLQSNNILRYRARKLYNLNLVKQRTSSKAKEQQNMKQKTIEGQHWKQDLLQNLNNSHLTNLEYDQQNQSALSYDSQIHDIYENFESESKFSLMFSSTIANNILDVRNMGQSKLIIDFTINKEKNKRQKQSKNSINSLVNNIGVSTENMLLKIPHYINLTSPDAKAQKEKQQKTSSFMQYYNSLAKKQTSNILKKYIKQKK